MNNYGEEEQKKYPPLWCDENVSEFFNYYENLRGSSVDEAKSSRLLGEIQGAGQGDHKTVYDMITALIEEMKEDNLQLYQKYKTASDESGYSVETIVSVILAGIHIQTIDRDLLEKIERE